MARLRRLEHGDGRAGALYWEVSRNGPGQPELLRAHSTFLETGSPGSGVRSVVAASWRRSMAAGINADHAVAPVMLEPSELIDYRGEHRLSRVFRCCTTTSL